ncbi:hypothetical protein [Stenotrophomonas sp. PS02289]|uniref:hypothetical protein n=1 Tax=Stenotrophomonas sp. PS02289 TaxID=2991422 RepID=UPI00249A91FC|nr:hypothetical protein [Stenotrophomonas sp. PS02289]
MSASLTAAYALPLSEAALAAYLDDGSLPASALERAGLFAAALCLRSRQPEGALSALLEEACALFAAQPGQAPAQLAGLRAGLPGTVQDWQRALAAQERVLAPAAVVEQHAALEAFDVMAFQQACDSTLTPHTVRFYTEAAYQETSEVIGSGERAPIYIERDHDYTDDQARALRAIVANDDEHIDLDAYAGAGKTHLVLQLLAGATRHFTYLAPRPSQVQAFRERLGTQQQITLLSQIGFANQVAADAHRRGVLGTDFAPAYQVSRLSFADIAGRIGLQPIGRYPATSVLRIAFDGIASWCRSTSPQLEARHFLRALPYAMLDATPFIAAAEQVWRCMFDPVLQKGGVLSLTPDHIGKWLAQHDARIPARWGTLLIDEAHDLSPAWKQLLSGYEGAVISLGDPNQRLIGRAPRFATGMALEINQSVRQGRYVEQLVNDTLALDATGVYQQPFNGAGAHATVASVYQHWNDVPSEGTQVYGSSWRLLEEAQRLSAAGAAFGIHPESLTQLGREVNRAADAYREMTTHGGSSRRWEALLAECEEQQVPQIPRLFMRGYNREHFAALCERLQPHTQATLLLMLVEHSKNTEFAQVAMAPCCFRTGFARRYAHNPVRAAYTAMTRGSRQLWLPEGALEELQRSVARYHDRKRP